MSTSDPSPLTSLGFPCPQCRAEVVSDLSLIGTEATCPRCGARAVVPEPRSRTLASSPNPTTPADPSRPAGFECPFCHAHDRPRLESRVTTGGWVVFALLLLICFPFSVLGLFIKEEYRVCRSCNIRLG
jgi:DNA-directed RNA polymerase subunit RPC12/RpoP